MARFGKGTVAMLSLIALIALVCMVMMIVAYAEYKKNNTATGGRILGITSGVVGAIGIGIGIIIIVIQTRG